MDPTHTRASGDLTSLGDIRSPPYGCDHVAQTSAGNTSGLTCSRNLAPLCRRYARASRPAGCRASPAGRIRPCQHAAHECHGAPRARAQGGGGRVRHPGPGVHQPHHPAADVLRTAGTSPSRAVAAAADDGAAGRASARWSPSGWPSARDSAALLRAGLLGDRGRGPGRSLPPPTSGSSSPRWRSYGVGLGIGRRHHQHAGGRARAPLRPADPAVVPRRLDPRRRRRRRAHARHAATCRSSATAVVAVRRRWRCSFAPFLPASRRAGRRRPPRSQVPWRPILLVGLAMVLFYMVDTAATTWGPTFLDRRLRRPVRPGRARDVPLPAGQRRCGWPATASSRGTARCRCCGSARWSPRAALRGRRVRPDLAGGGPRASRCSAPASPVIAPLSFSAAARIAGGDEPDPACARPGSTR